MRQTDRRLSAFLLDDTLSMMSFPLDVTALTQNQHYPTATLYMVATPIGNAADISLRALHVLGLVDRIAAEDTRNTKQLLSRYGITKPLLAGHEHNEREAAARVIDYLRAGERIAFVSDAGTPGISDPGARLVEAVRKAGLQVTPLPGASALTAALSVAGGWARDFRFVGFLPTKTQQGTRVLQKFTTDTAALVFYEAPHRIAATLQSLADTLGTEREILIARELTKLHETLHRCTLAEAPSWLAADANRQRGEFVLVVEGARPRGQTRTDEQHDTLLRTLLDEVSVSMAAKIAAHLSGVSRAALYERALTLKSR